jgi:hypothetical protein
MGTVINFPEVQNVSRDVVDAELGQSATIMILPVIRVERAVDGPSDSEPASQGAGRKRRRRARRS